MSQKLTLSGSLSPSLELTHRSTPSPSTIDPTQTKIEEYVRSLKEMSQEIPKVKYSAWMSIKISNLCNSATCCFQSRCCTTEKVQYLMTQSSKNGHILYSQKREEAPTQEMNEMTNSTFFASLYDAHGDCLAYLMSSVISYLPTKESKEFWRNWDPKSKEPLDAKRAMNFRDLLASAHQVYDEVRVQMMKQDMLNMFQSTKIRGLERSLVKARERALSGHVTFRGGPGAVAFSPSEPPESDIMPAPRLREIPLEEGLRKLAIFDEEKMIIIKDRTVPFDEDMLVKDILLMCECSSKKAHKIARAVKSLIPPFCTSDELWDVLKEHIREAQVPIKCSTKDPFCREVLARAQKADAVTIKEIPVDDFAEILKIKKTSKSGAILKSKPYESSESFQQSVERDSPSEVLERSSERKEPKSMITFV